MIDTILKALAPALPDRIPAAHKGDMGGCSFSGFRADGRRFLLMNIFGGGWGGRPREDGESASVSICQGDVRNAPVELQEIQYPFLIERFALRRDSGGAGRHRGGLGVELTYRALGKTLTNVNCERTKDPPWGLNGGKPGAVNEAVLVRRDGSEQKLLKATGVPMEPGDRLIFRTAGGGGWGDPRLRDRARIRATMSPKGYVSRAGGAARLRLFDDAQDERGGVTAQSMTGNMAAHHARRCAAAARLLARDAGGRASTRSSSTATPGRAIICAMSRISASWKATASRVIGGGRRDRAVSRQRHRCRARRGGDAPGVAVRLAGDIARAVGARLDRVANHRLAAAPRRSCRMARRRRAQLHASRTARALLDQLLMHKLPAEIDAIRRAARARRRRLWGVPSRRSRRAGANTRSWPISKPICGGAAARTIS